MRLIAGLMLLALSAGCDAYSEKKDDAPAEGCQGERAGYPAGPFGTSEGAVIADLAFTDSEGTALKLSDLHRSCEQRVMVAVTAAGWCTACREEQPKLQALYEAFGARGLTIVEAYFEDDDFEPAELSHVVNWKDQYDLTFPVVLDADFAFGAYYDRELTPMTMVVDLETMKILKIMTGYDDSTIRSLVEATL